MQSNKKANSEGNVVLEIGNSPPISSHQVGSAIAAWYTTRPFPAKEYLRFSSEKFSPGTKAWRSNCLF
jgi:hypothetical protein